MRHIDHFINGSSLTDRIRESDVWNPSQGEVQARVGLGNVDTLQKAVDAALAAQPAWAATNPQRRARVMPDYATHANMGLQWKTSRRSISFGMVALTPN